MLAKAPFLIGLRYTRAKRSHAFLSLISMVSVFGIALGVAVIITILSVVNGFDREIKKSIFSMVAPITIAPVEGRLTDWQALSQTVQRAPEITAAAPLVMGQAMLQEGAQNQPTLLIGIDPLLESHVSSLADRVVSGNLAALTAPDSILIGQQLATALQVQLKDEVTLIIPRRASGNGFTTQLRNLRVVGIFKTGGGGGTSYDAKLAVTSLKTAQDLFGLGGAVNALRLNVTNLYAAPTIANDLQDQLPGDLQVNNWTQQLGAFFDNIKTTKSLLFFILQMLVVVAAFNLITMLIMTVNHKQTDIAILRTIGMKPRDVLLIFMVQGTLIGALGVGIGVLLGVLLATNITSIVNVIQAVFHIKLISSSVYFVDFLPSELNWQDVGLISVITVLLSMLATIYPAWRAARLQPVEALRDA